MSQLDGLAEDVTERGERVTPDSRGWGYYAHLSIYAFAAPLLSGRRVVDIGCGTGYGSYYLLEHGAASVHGVDVSERAILYCRRNFIAPDLTFDVVDAEAFDAAGLGPVEGVFSSNALEHIAGVDELLERIAAAMTADGIAVLAVPPVISAGALEGNLLNPYHLNNLPPGNWLRKIGRYFESVQGYRHWLTPNWVDDKNWPKGLETAPAETVIRETDFTFTPLSNAEMDAQTHNITCVIVARQPRRQPSAREIGEHGVPAEWGLPAIENRVRATYASMIAPFLQEWEGHLVREVNHEGHAGSVFLIKDGLRTPAPSADLRSETATKAINSLAAQVIPVLDWQTGLLDGWRLTAGDPASDGQAAQETIYKAQLAVLKKQLDDRSAQESTYQAELAALRKQLDDRSAKESIYKAHLAALNKQLDDIYASPLWRLATGYRRWLDRGRQHRGFIRMVYDPIVSRIIQFAVSATAGGRVAPDLHNGAGPITRSDLNGRIIACADGPFANRRFYVDSWGYRHRIPSDHHLESQGFSMRDVSWVDSPEVSRYKPGGPVPLKWTDADWFSPPRDSSLKLREVATSRLTGVGVEFGAGTSALAIPIQCQVRFADRVPESELRKQAYAGQGDDFVELSYITDLETMDGIEEGSLDFIIACHVIEHTKNPLMAFRKAYSKLRPDGRFVVVVPDKERTFDKDRDVTPLEHLILDYTHPLPERDAMHYFEFFSRAFVTPVESLYSRVLEAIETNYNIHFHTWTYKSFREMVDYSTTGISPWSEIWSQPAIDHPDANEFYYVLKK